MTWEPAVALYVLLISGNLVAILACLYFGQPLIRLCRFFLWSNGVIVGIAVIPLISVLHSMQNSSEAGLALGAVLLMPLPFIAEFLALAAIYRWRMHQSQNSSPRKE